MQFKSTYLALALLAGFGLALGACSSSSDDPPEMEVVEPTPDPTPHACDAGPSQECVDARQAELDAIGDDATVAELQAAQTALTAAQTAWNAAEAARMAAEARQALVDAAMCTAGTEECVAAHQALVDALEADETTTNAELEAAMAGLSAAQMALADANDAAARQVLINAAACTEGTAECVAAHQALVDALEADPDASATDLAAAQTALANVQAAKETADANAAAAAARQALVDAAMCTEGTAECVAAHQALVDALEDDDTTLASDLDAARAALAAVQTAKAEADDADEAERLAQEAAEQALAAAQEAVTAAQEAVDELAEDATQEDVDAANELVTAARDALDGVDDADLETQVASLESMITGHNDRITEAERLVAEAAATKVALAVEKALASPTVAANDNGVPGGATITRSTAGERKITLMNTPDSGTDLVAFDPKYGASEKATPVITGWYGETQMRSSDNAPVENAVVYTDIKSAKPQKLAYDRDGTTDVPDFPDVTAVPNVFVLADKTKTSYTGSDTDDAQDQSVMGTLNGVPGTFTCTTGTCEVTFVASPTTGVDPNTVATFGAAGWAFKSTDYVEAEATQDADYMYFGYWLQEADEDGAYAFATFSGGSMSSSASTDNVTSLEGMATYDGKAGGKYVTKELALVDGEVETTSAVKGQFTADVALTAYFSGGDVPVNKQNRLEGSVTNFMDGDTELDFEIKLGLTAFTDADASTESGTISGRHGTALASGGSWNGRFFGAIETDSDDVETGNQSTLPSGVAGTFDAHFPDARVAGAYGANKE